MHVNPKRPVQWGSANVMWLKETVVQEKILKYDLEIVQEAKTTFWEDVESCLDRLRSKTRLCVVRSPCGDGESIRDLELC
jgi:hypothetical protein